MIKLQEFKKGAFRTSLNTGVPIVVIGLLGTYGIAPAGTVPRRWGHQVTVLIGKPIFPQAEESVAAYMDRYRVALVGLLSSG